jgi:hypothetical protein
VIGSNFNGIFPFGLWGVGSDRADEDEDDGFAGDDSEIENRFDNGRCDDFLVGDDGGDDDDLRRKERGVDNPPKDLINL